jgi:hypothetical protein
LRLRLLHPFFLGGPGFLHFLFPYVIRDLLHRGIRLRATAAQRQQNAKQAYPGKNLSHFLLPKMDLHQMEMRDDEHFTVIELCDKFKQADHNFA